jgi:hypothetical protein
MLADLINQHALDDARAGKWDAVANALNALRSEIIDQTHWSFGLMMSQGQLPQELVVGIAAAIKNAAAKNPLMESAFIAFSTTGLQLHTDERQTMIEAIGAGLQMEAVAAVKSLGVRYVPVVTTTAEQCQSAYESTRLAQQWATVQNEIINPAVGNRADLIAALKAAIETLEAG